MYTHVTEFKTLLVGPVDVTIPTNTLFSGYSRLPYTESSAQDFLFIVTNFQCYQSAASTEVQTLTVVHVHLSKFELY